MAITTPSHTGSLRLTTLGGLSLEAEQGVLVGASAQRRRLALLAVLASAGRRAVSRDRLAVLLWPDSDAERARHALAQLLYVVRRDLSVEPIVATPTELRLDPTVVASDVDDFEAAIAVGDWARAVALYRGPFLGEFHLPDAPEFERWADGERRRRAEQVAGAFRALATAASSRGDHAAAVEHWRRLAALDPLDSDIARALMRALDAAGNRSGALQHARIHDALLRDQLGVLADPALVAYAEQLRAAPAPCARRSAAGPALDSSSWRVSSWWERSLCRAHGGRGRCGGRRRRPRPGRRPWPCCHSPSAALPTWATCGRGWLIS